MDHREPRRNSAAEGRTRDPIEVADAPAPEGSGADARLRRLLPQTTPARLSRRMLVLGAVGIVILLLLATLVGLLGRAVGRYVHEHPTNLIQTSDIVLEPKVPSWFRGGHEAFLRTVVSEARLAPQYSLLDLDLGLLYDAFRRSPWIARVVRVERQASKQVVVHLEYCRPIAVSRYEKQLGMAVALVDGRAVLLPRGDIEADETRRLIRLQNFPPPDDPSPLGKEWSHLDPRQGLSRPDEHVREATRLAAFLFDRLERDPLPFPARPEVFILRDDSGRLYVQVGASLMFRWSEPTETNRKPMTNEEKWSQLHEQIQKSPPQASDAEWMPLYRFTVHGAMVESRINRRGKGNHASSN